MNRKNQGRVSSANTGQRAAGNNRLETRTNGLGQELTSRPTAENADSRNEDDGSMRRANVEGGTPVPLSEQMIARHPVATLAVSFGVGFGLGVLAVGLFRRDEESWMTRASRTTLPHSLSSLTTKLEHLRDRISDHVPDSIRRMV